MQLRLDVYCSSNTKLSSDLRAFKEYSDSRKIYQSSNRAYFPNTLYIYIIDNRIILFILKKKK